MVIALTFHELGTITWSVAAIMVVGYIIVRAGRFP